jgi:hypothetical protein
MEELAVGAGTDLVNRRGVQVDEDGARDVFAIARLGEEGLERSHITDVLGRGRRTAVGSEAMLEEVP